MSAYHDIIAASKDVPGWMDVTSAAIWDCLLGFQNSFAPTGDLVEIGLYEGKSALCLGHYLRDNEQLVLIESILLDSASNRLNAAFPNRCRFVHDYSTRIHGQLNYLNNRVRFAHIDGEHSGTAVINDLLLCNQWLAADGIIAVDDFMFARYPQVTRAVFEVIGNPSNQLAMFLCGFNKAYLCRPAILKRMLEFIHGNLLSHLDQCGLNQNTLHKSALAFDMNCFGITPKEHDRRLWGVDWQPDYLEF